MNELVELLDELQKKAKADRILRNLPCLWRFHL